MRVSATAKFIRISPRKVRLVTDLITGKPVEEAAAILRFLPNAAARDVARLLKIRTGSPLLVMTRTSAFANGACCDHSTFHICPDRYEFFASCTFQLGE